MASSTDPALLPDRFRSKRHRRGLVTPESVRAVLAQRPDATLRYIQEQLGGGSFRDLSDVVRQLRGHVSPGVHEALVAGDGIGQALIAALHSLEFVTQQVRAEQVKHAEQLAMIKASLAQRTPSVDSTYLSIEIGECRREIQTLRKALASPTAVSTQTAAKAHPDALEERLEPNTREHAAPTSTSPAAIPTIDPSALEMMRLEQLTLAATTRQLRDDQQHLAANVSAMHRDLVERHAHHGHRLSESDAAHQRELAHIHRHLAAVRTDLAGVQTDVGTAHTKLLQTHRAQATALRRTLRMLAMTQLQAAATAAAAIGEAAARERRNAQAIRRILQTPTRRPTPAVKAQRSVSRPLAKATRHTGVRSPLARKPTTAQPRMRPGRTATPKASPPKVPHASTSRVPKRRRQ
jgi:hypothetical protein